MIPSAILGALGWTLAEHLLHDRYGHRPAGGNEFSREHLAHHRDTTYFTPTWKKLAMAILPVLAIAAVGSAVAGPRLGLSFAGGFTAMYAFYEWLHRRIHTHAPLGFYGRWARRHHLHHHHRNPASNHGVTSPLWDVVFRTLERPGQVSIARRKAPPWLKAEDGTLLPRFERDFRLM